MIALPTISPLPKGGLFNLITDSLVRPTAELKNAVKPPKPGVLDDVFSGLSDAPQNGPLAKMTPDDIHLLVKPKVVEPEINNFDIRLEQSAQGPANAPEIRQITEPPAVPKRLEGSNRVESPLLGSEKMEKPTRRSHDPPNPAANLHAETGDISKQGNNQRDIAKTALIAATVAGTSGGIGFSLTHD